MRRYWIDTKNINENTVQITGEVFHHIFSVCRQEIGSKFELIIDSGVALFVVVTTKEKKFATAEILERRTIPQLPLPHLNLVLSVPRFPVFESILEKAVELGVANIQLVFSENSFVRNLDSIPATKIDRWEKIIRSASQQSGRGELMKLSTPKKLVDFITQINPTKGQACLFAYENSQNLGFKNFLTQQKTGFIDQRPEQYWIFVGSEGGYSPSEVKKMEDLGFHPVSLGSQVLRVETACIALLSVLKYELGLSG